MNICVFCSASEVAEEYTQEAKSFATLLGENGHTLIWGGSDRGVMKVMASGVQEAGGKIVGVSVELLRDHARKDADEMIFAQDLGERQAIMLERADVVVAMVGGIGTLDELTEVLEQKKHSLHEKPVIVLNTNGFFDGLKLQLQRMDSEGFLKSAKRILPLNEMIYFADTPEAAMEYINSHDN